LRALDLLNALERGVTISATAGMTVLQSNRSPQNAMQLAAEKEFCAWRLAAGTTALGRKPQSLQDFLCALGAQAADMSRISRETENHAISGSYVVELRGFEPLTSAVRALRARRLRCLQGLRPRGAAGPNARSAPASLALRRARAASMQDLVLRCDGPNFGQPPSNTFERQVESGEYVMEDEIEARTIAWTRSSASSPSC
jgi:hypothetical protein